MPVAAWQHPLLLQIIIAYRNIKRLVLIYPGLGLIASEGSNVTHAHAPLLSAADMQAYYALYSGGQDLFDDPLFAPIHASDLSMIPPTKIFVAGCDPLADDGVVFADILEKQGIDG